jgi:hypothetical protein
MTEENSNEQEILNGENDHISTENDKPTELSIGPFRFCGRSPQMTLVGGFFTELQVETNYFIEHSLTSDSDLVYIGDFVPLVLGSEVCLDSTQRNHTDEARFVFCGSNPDCDSELESCFGIVLDCSDLQFYAIPLTSLRFYHNPRDWQGILLENTESLNAWIKNMHSNNLSLHEFGYNTTAKPRSKKISNPRSSLPTRESYGRQSAIAARKRIIEQSPTKNRPNQLETHGSNTRNKRAILGSKLATVGCSCTNDVKKLSPLIATLIKTNEKQNAKLAALESSLKDMKSALAAAVSEIKAAAKKQKMEHKTPKSQGNVQSEPPVNLPQMFLNLQNLGLMQGNRPTPSAGLILPAAQQMASINPAMSSKMWLQAPNGEWKYVDV